MAEEVLASEKEVTATVNEMENDIEMATVNIETIAAMEEQTVTL